MSTPYPRRLALSWLDVDPALTIARLLTLAIICVYLLPGLIGRHPLLWKGSPGEADERFFLFEDRS